MPRQDRYGPPPGLGPAQEHFWYWRRHIEDPSFVYVIQGEGATAVKVGVAKDVAARMSGLQTGNPLLLQMLYVMPGDYRLEAFLHRQLKGAWVRGEWFDGPAIDPFLAWVKALARRMVRHHKRTGEIPDYSVLPATAGRSREPKPQNPITVRHVEPDPKLTGEELTRKRDELILSGRSPHIKI